MIILAAGNSARMGQCKFFLEFKNGKSFIEALLDAAFLFAFDKTTIVVNSNYLNDLIFRIGNKHWFHKIQIIENTQYTLGRFYSLKLGLGANFGIEYFFVSNADSPYLPLPVLTGLFSNRKNASVIIPTYQNQGGHPVLFNRMVANNLLLCNDSSVLSNELKRFKRYKVAFNDDSILRNINTPDDYFGLINQLHD